MAARNKKRLYFPFFENIHGKKVTKLEPTDTAFHLLTIEHIEDKHSLFEDWVKERNVDITQEHKKYKYKAFIEGKSRYNILHILSKSYKELVKLGMYLSKMPRSRMDITLYLRERDFLVAHEDTSMKIQKTKNNINVKHIVNFLNYHTRIWTPGVMWPTQPRLGNYIYNGERNKLLPPRPEEDEEYQYKIDFVLDYCKISLYHKDLKKLLETIEIVFYKYKYDGKTVYEDAFIIDRLEEEGVTVKRNRRYSAK